MKLTTTLRLSALVVQLVLAGVGRAQGAPEQAQTAFLSLSAANTPIKGYSTNTNYKDDFDVYALTASPTAAGGAVTLHATLSLESAPLLIQALDHNQVITFDVTFVKPGANGLSAPFAVLKGVQGQLTGFSIVAVSGRPMRVQLTLVANSTKLTTPTGQTLASAIPIVTARAAGAVAATTIRAQPFMTKVEGEIAHSGATSGPTAGVAIDTLTFDLARPAGNSVSKISSMHFVTHADNAIGALTQAASRAESVNGTRFAIYQPGANGLPPTQATLVIELDAAAFASATQAAGGGTAGRSDTRSLPPGSYDLTIAAAAPAPFHVLQISQPTHATTATVH